MDKNVKAIIATPQNGERNMELTWVTEHSKKSVTEHLGEAELPRTSLQALQETYTKMGKDGKNSFQRLAGHPWPQHS